MKLVLYTIGHSSHSLLHFINLLKRNAITAVADVRSVPYSQFTPHFNREMLSENLKQEDIEYVFLGDNLGARIDAPECYEDGKVVFRLVEKHPKFIEGIKRLKKGMASYRIALMCAEKDPITCHRTILVCKHLKSEGVNIKHILSDGTIEDQNTSEERLMRLFRLDHPNLFKANSERLEEAYCRQSQEIAYSNTDSLQKENIGEQGNV